MASVPSVNGSTVVSALKRHGFEVDRIKGSHHIMKHPDGRGTTVPVHNGKDVPKGTLGSILTDVGLTIEQLLDKGVARAAEQQRLLDLQKGAADAQGATKPQPAKQQSTRRHGSRRGQGRDGR